MIARAPRWCPLVTALVACEGEAPPVLDAGRFDAREATVAPLDAFDAAVEDLATTVDVRVADAPSPLDVRAADAPGADASTACVDLANEHAAAVREAQRCLRDEDCAAVVCETLCCSCEVFVQRGASVAAQALLARGEALGCAASLPCSRVPCARPVAAVCSGEGRCVTLRVAPGADGGLDGSS